MDKPSDLVNKVEKKVEEKVEKKVEKKLENKVVDDKEDTKINESTNSKMNELRSKVLDYIEKNPDDIHPLDVELLKTSDLWINRFLNFNKQSIETAFSHLIETFKYRKESGIRSIDKTTIGIELWLSGVTYIYLPDKEGCPVLYIRVSHYIKPGGLYDDLFKKFILILLDEVDTLGNKEFGFNIFLDLCNIGWKNFDLEMLHYVIRTSRNRYPNGCKNFFIYGIPWAFNYILKSVVAALPSDSTKKIKIVAGSHYDELPLNKFKSNFTKTDLNNNTNKSEKKEDQKRNKLPIEEFIDIENLPPYLGGKATLNYRIAPRNAMSINKVGTSIFNYSEEENKRLLKSHQKFINDANNCYKTFKEANFDFEFDLECLTETYVQHIRL